MRVATPLEHTLTNLTVSDTDGSALTADVRLQCPRCGSGLVGLHCRLCQFHLRNCGGIVKALPPDRAAHFARFIADYERIRDAEGRGSETDDFYIGLPYRDATGRNGEQWRIRARSYDCLLGRVLDPNRTANGERILDLGAGNCWMSFRLAMAGYCPVAVDLLINDRDGLGAAKHYRKYLPRLFPRFQAELAHLPFRDEQFDAAIFNASFHYAENYEAALQEAVRCVRAGGMVIVSDTPWYSNDDSGQRMLAERGADFLHRYGTASDSIRNLEYLTDERLADLEKCLSIRWTVHSPRYGFRWTMRPFAARLRKRREPSRFRIYVARKPVT